MEHPLSRRKALHKACAGLAVAPFLQGIAARAADQSGRTPKRFVFVVRANGILPTELQPQGLESLVRPRGARLSQKKLITAPLKDHSLSRGLAPLEPWRHQVTVLQGLSGRMANESHGAGYGALGACRGAKGGAPPTTPTVDGLLSRSFNTPFAHLGLAMEEIGPQVVYTGLFAAAAKKPLPCYADPMTAYQDLFGSVVTDRQLKAAAAVDRNVLDFMVSDINRFRATLPGVEKEKLEHYLEGFRSLKAQGEKLRAMKKQLTAAAPDLTDDFRSDVEIERLKAHFQLATSALIGGLTQVVSIRADHLGLRLTGLGLGSKTVHQIGHMIEGEKGGSGGEKFDNGMGEFATRERIMNFHMQQIASMAKQLEAVPEEDGTMLDNTVILYLSDHGEKHHSNCFEWPMVALGTAGGALKAGQYIHVPGWGEGGHNTIAHAYVSLLQAAGIEQDQFGQPDLTLPSSIDQTGPLSAWVS